MALAISIAPLPLVSAAPMVERERAKSLKIYLIDLVGGQSTLIVTPTGQSLLIDTGWAGSGSGFHPGNSRQACDANRIVAAAHDAELDRSTIGS